MAVIVDVPDQDYSYFDAMICLHDQYPDIFNLGVIKEQAILALDSPKTTEIELKGAIRFTEYFQQLIKENGGDTFIEERGMRWFDTERM